MEADDAGVMFYSERSEKAFYKPVYFLPDDFIAMPEIGYDVQEDELQLALGHPLVQRFITLGFAKSRSTNSRIFKPDPAL